MVRGPLRGGLAVAVLLCALPTGAVTAERVDRYVRDFWVRETAATPLAGMLLIVVRPDAVLHASGAGYARRPPQRHPMDPRRTLVRLASVSKTFLWTAVLQARVRGELALDDVVRDAVAVVPDVPGWPPVRIVHLMTHTAGFEDRQLGRLRARQADLVPLAAHLQGRDLVRVRPPGTRVAYSNHGAALAARFLEVRTGLPWEHLLQERLLDPLGLDSTFPALPPAEERSRLADGHDRDLRPLPYWHHLEPASGGMVSTAADMGRWLRFHLGGIEVAPRGLPGDEVRRLREPVAVGAAGERLPGLHRHDRGGVAIVGHTGDLGGFHSGWYLLPEEGLGLFVVLNAEAGAQARTRFLDGFVESVLGAGPGPQVASPGSAVPEPVAEELAGPWIPAQRAFSTFEKLAWLTATAPVRPAPDGIVLGRGASATRFVRLGPDRLVAPDTGETLHLRRSRDGRITHLERDRRISALERLPVHARPELHGVVLVLAGGLVVAGAGRALRQPRAWPPLAAAALAVGTVTLLLAGLAMPASAFALGVPWIVDAARAGSLLVPLAAVAVLADAMWRRSRRARGAGVRVALGSLLLFLQALYWRVPPLP